MSQRSKRQTNEEGVTLVELLIAISITGIIAVGLLAGLVTLAISSDRARKGSDGGSALYTAADALQTLAYNTACPATYSLASPAGFPATPADMRVRGSNITITSVEYWNPVTSSFTATCTPSLPLGDARRLQRVTLRASLPDGRIDRTLDVVKRG